ncbi:hypothetical protein Afil01_17260 [Actinorhabdospora filicis]|uniref:PH domain-containing protein n=1 Tax=Actinorhabdospora filicis TaxID=1785913 RepID=A0A9W6SGW2_9ACTN|nr:hypothetical protein [Actinorhabdospora filicis]GLZ76919.1 hypothetical protein Afil01_17260 [Actinorhabdospora filicis]
MTTTPRPRARGEARVRLRRRFPWRHVLRLLAYLVLAAAILALTRYLFAMEPDMLDTGVPNPLRHAEAFVAGVLIAGTIPYAYRLMRLPKLEVNHFGLIVRPGALRTLVLPWVHIEQVAVYTAAKGRTYLLIACDGHQGRLGDRPGYGDRIVLREALHLTGGMLADFDLAVRSRDFADTPSAQLAQLSAFAPAHVDVVDATEA